MDVLAGVERFDWDEGNSGKNLQKHDVSNAECEETLLNEPLYIMEDMRNSSQEKRDFALGMTYDGRRLTLVFTMRDRLVRVISARDMSRKERHTYEKIRKNSGF
jgi:uncharacterized DUF497 family protein